MKKAFIFGMLTIAMVHGCASDDDDGARPGTQGTMDAGLGDATTGDLGRLDASNDSGAPDQETSDDLGSGDMGTPDQGTPENGPRADFHRYCSEPWERTMEPDTIGPAGGQYVGGYQGLPQGTLETIKVVPSHPFLAEKILVAFAAGDGPARIRLMRSWGRSYPDVASDHGDLVAPLEVEIRAPDPEQWIELPLPGDGVFLHPTEHYVLVYEHLAEGPYLAIEEIQPPDYSRSLILVPGEATPYGVEGNYRIRLEGHTFCRWGADDGWFERRVDGPYAEIPSSRAAFADIDGDGHDDLILNTGTPVALLGDGHGNFTPLDYDPFEAVPRRSMLVFGDLDNDGDQDVFAATYMNWDADGDGVTIVDGDCDDTRDDVFDGAAEVMGDGVDQDCDRIADTGEAPDDADGDGVTVAEGDCDDTRDDVLPGAPEVMDSRDNDCDGTVDEGFEHRILLNDGTGHFQAVEAAGVEVREPTAAAALGDVDGDGNLDVYWGNWLVHYPLPLSVDDHLALGNGDGTFRDVTEAAGLRPSMGPEPAYGVLFVDYDDDGLQDIWVGNYGYGLNFLWHNLGDGTFEEIGYELGLARDSIDVQGGNTFGGDFGDFDNDGDLDMYAANIAHPRYQPWSDPSVFLVNQGPPDYTFEEATRELGFVYDEGDVNAAFADFDNDMDLDLVVASLYRGHFSRLYRNDGPAGFTDVTYEAGVAVNDSVSPVWSDVDEDGDLDLVIADRWGPQQVQLFINRVGQDNHWVEFKLQGTTTNRDGVGARVVLEAGGVTQVREVEAGGGHSNTQSTSWVHFGLAKVGRIDRLTVRWVGGQEEEFQGIEPNHRYLLVEGSGVGERL